MVTCLDIYGRRIGVPALFRGGEHKYSKFRGIINAFKCGSFQRVKLVGFTEYNFDDGIKIPENHYLIGIRKWGEFYVVLFKGKPRASSKQPERYTNNVHFLHKSH